MENDWVASLRKGRNESDKSWTVAVLLSVLLGYLGADRFYLGRGDLGFWKLLTIGGFLIWWLIDIVLLLLGRMKDGYGRVVVPLS
jgi:TM2 domain-containing membrane protein YozV